MSRPRPVTVLYGTGGAGAALLIYDVLAADRGQLRLPEIPVQLNTLLVGVLVVVAVLAGVARLVERADRAFQLGRSFEAGQAGERDLSLVHGGPPAQRHGT